MGNPRVERLIQQAVSDVFLYDLHDDLADLMVSVTRVDVSPRLEKAVVYVSAALLDNAAELVATLNRHRSRLRYLVGRRIRHRVRHIPELHFRLDDSVIFRERLDELIGRKPPQPPQDGDPQPHGEPPEDG